MHRERHAYQGGNGRPGGQRHEELGESLNVTHYTHWSNLDYVAEKHDDSLFGEEGDVIERFSASCSSNKSGCFQLSPRRIRNNLKRVPIRLGSSSPAFVVDTTLCIPTIFISYTGEALDYKHLAQGTAAVDAPPPSMQLF